MIPKVDIRKRGVWAFILHLYTFFTKYLWWSLSAKWRWRNCPTCEKWPSVPQAWGMSRPIDESKVPPITPEDRAELQRLGQAVLDSLDRMRV